MFFSLGTATRIGLIFCSLSGFGCTANAADDPTDSDGVDTEVNETDTSVDDSDTDVVDMTVPPEVLSAPATVETQGIHVATNGSDGGDGSEQNPYATVQHALDNADSGDVILLHQGTYNEQVRIRDNHITLQSAPGESAHITCEVSTDADDPPLCVHIDAETTGVTLRGLEISGGFYSVFLGSQWDWDDTPQDNLAANHVLIEDCVLHGSGRDVVKIPAGCDDITIQRTEIYDSGIGYEEGTSLDDMNAEGVDAVNSDRLRIADSYIHDTATTCAYIKGGSIDSIIERTVAERCGALGLALGFDTSPEFFDTEVNPGYYENIGGVIRNCIVSDTGYAGIALYASRDAYVLHNTVRGAASLGQAAIYFGVATQDYDPEAGRPPNVRPTVVGNVVDQTGIDEPVCISIRYDEDDQLGVLSGLSGPATIHHNLYYAGGGSCAFTDARPDSLVQDGDLAAWQANGVDADSSFEDPLLAEDGHLNDGSLAMNATLVTPGVSYDIDRESRSDGLFDRGADER